MNHNHSRNPVSQVKARKAWLGMVLGSLSVVAACLVIRQYWGAEPASADSAAQASVRKTAARPAATGRQPSRPTARGGYSRLKVFATVNGRQITHEVLGRECLRHYGKEVLESWINKLLIAQECKRRNIVVTRVEVDGEIRRMAGRFSLPVEQWLKMLQQERGISPAQYASDIIWPTLALRRLAGERLKVTREEMLKAYETKYGPSVRARLISCKDLDRAKRLHAAAVADPEGFGDLAKEHSEDASASLKGVIQPIRKHGSYKEIEQAAFNMKDGDISKVIPAGGQYVILKREGLLPGAKVDNFKRVAPQLEELIREGKMRRAAAGIFRKLQEDANVVNVFNDPARRRGMPGIAAVINGQQITTGQLAQRCIERHGPEVLEGTINRTLIELACEKRKITITEAEIDREIVRAASDSLPPKDGKPDVEGWLKLVTERQGVSADVYRRDSVWPSVALKKLVGDEVTVTEEDKQKGYEANFGPRVRCLAIIMNNFRRTQEVWEMARGNRTAEYFGELAEQYSIEPSSRALRGEVPPIKKHGGRPLLEEEAFSLKPGDISGIIQVGERYIILYCLGHTKSTKVSFDEVREEIYKEIYEKKQRLAMARYFQQLQDTATIDNYLAGTTQRPKKPAGTKSSARLPNPRQVPSRR